MDITYDKQGRMQYHPELHDQHKRPWTTTDQQFLIENYDAMGPEQISLALGRTIHTVAARACLLRKRGQMPKPKKPTMHRRLRFADKDWA